MLKEGEGPSRTNSGLRPSLFFEETFYNGVGDLKCEWGDGRRVVRTDFKVGLVSFVDETLPGP